MRAVQIELGSVSIDRLIVGRRDYEVLVCHDFFQMRHAVDLVFYSRARQLQLACSTSVRGCSRSCLYVLLLFLILLCLFLRLTFFYFLFFPTVN